LREKASNLPEQLRLLRDLYEEENGTADRLFYRFVGVASKIVTVSGDRHDLHRTYMPIILAGPKI